MAKGYKTGGRRKGTPNRNNPIKGILARHSERYFTPRLQTDLDGEQRDISDFDLDLRALDPVARVQAELRILEFHTPKMKSQDINMELSVGPRTIEDTLARLCGDPEADQDEDE